MLVIKTLREVRLLSLVGVLCSLIAQLAMGAVSEPYAVATWSGFRQAAVSYTFDDLKKNQYDAVLSAFTQAGIGVTLFTTTDTAWATPGWSYLQAAANDGHEVASLTASNTSLGGMTMEEQRSELEDSRNAIEARVAGQSGLTLAYPGCLPIDDALVAEQYIAARVCTGLVEQATPGNFLRISSVSCGTGGTVNSLGDFQSTAGDAVASGGWLVYHLRSIGIWGDSPITSNILLESIHFYDEESGTFWVDTFGNIVRYIRERDEATVIELAEDEDKIQLTLSDTLDDAIYNFPLTLRRNLPEGWIAVRATQDGQSLRSSIVQGDGGLEIHFDAIPDAGKILIERVDPSPSLSVTTACEEDQLRFHLEGVNGVQYTLFQSSDLSEWTPIEDGISERPAVFDKPIGAAAQFYRAAPSAIQSGMDPEGWNQIGAGHPFIEYSGRSRGTGTATVTFGYSGARMRMRFEGDAVGMYMEDDSGDNHVMFWIDDEARGKIRLDRQDGFYKLAGNLGPGPHTVEVVRVTECLFGLNHFKGFALKGELARVLEWGDLTDRQIEFIGDSITCGYGLEASSPSEGFSATTENFSLTYAGLTARALRADYLAVCRSGNGIFRNFDGPYTGTTNDMPDVYPDLFYLLPAYGSWNPELYVPDVVCINLGTNDFSTNGGNIGTFIRDYITFGSMLLTRYPEAMLVVIQGPMNTSDDLKNALDQVIVQLNGDFPGRVHFCALSGQGSVGYGGSYHPNRAQSEINAAELTAFLRNLLGWEARGKQGTGK